MTRETHASALARIEELMSSEPEVGSPEGDELVALATEVEAFEDRAYGDFDRTSEEIEEAFAEADTEAWLAEAEAIAAAAEAAAFAATYGEAA